MNQDDMINYIWTNQCAINKSLTNSVINTAKKVSKTNLLLNVSVLVLGYSIYVQAKKIEILNTKIENLSKKDISKEGE